ncbi:MAG: hypothetical protein ACRDUV_09855, partial [Pseudonocardiaceae bacterium]
MTETLYALAILACPVGMGLMMWLMMRGGKSDHKAPATDRDPELDRLRREVAELRAGQEDRRGSP